jgi:hypothetical protein
MHNDTQHNLSGYVHNQHPDVLADLAASHTHRTGCPPLFLISQEVTMDPQPFLNTISMQLFHKGLTTGTKIHTISLLILLSSGMTTEDMARIVLYEAERNDGIVFLEDTYRYDYSAKKAMMLLELLARAYQNPVSRCPLVMKAPAPSDRQIFMGCPSLQKNCFHLSAEPFRNENFRAAQPQPPRREPAPEVRQVPPRESAPEALYHNRQVQPEPVMGDPVFMPKKTVKKTGIWYKDNKELLTKEYEGLLKFLHKKNMNFHMKEAPWYTPYSKRLCLTVQLSFMDVGRYELTIVYENNYHQGNLSLVSVAVGGYDRERLIMLLRSIPGKKDRELGFHRYYPALKEQVAAEYGAAAAIVDGFIRSVILSNR